jgi:hypothetical protein
VVAVVFFVLTHPRPMAPSPFSTDEARIANWAVSIYETLFIAILPPTIVWLLVGWSGRRERR